MKYHVIFLVIATTLISQDVLSTVLHWPECKNGILSIRNKSITEQKLWLQKFDPVLKSESEIILTPNENIKIQIDKKNTSERKSLLHFSKSQDIDASFQCVGKNYYATSIEGGVQTFRKSDLNQQIFYIKNLYTSKNNLKIEILDKYRLSVHTISLVLNSNEQRKIMLPKNLNLFFVRISAGNKFVAFNLNSTGSQNPMIADAQAVSENLKGVYFEIGPHMGNGDTFTVLISDQKLIDKARLQLMQPQLEKMVFAKIQKGHNYQNRNLASVTKSFWNWSVTEVTNIADIGSTACNGLPQTVDDRIDSWSTDPGRICFWTYRIKREVPAAEIATGQKIN